MVNIPAYCDNCNIWITSPFGSAGNNVQNVSFQNIGIGCPKCDGRASIIDGVYNVVDGVLEIVKSHDLTAKELKTLTRILQQAIARNTPAGQVREIIAREVPKAKILNKFVTDNAGLAFVLTAILAALQIIVPLLTTSNSNQIDKEKIAKEILESKPQATPEPKKKTKDGVNDPCWCGSGKKRKKCHGLKSRPNPIRNLNQKPK